MRSTSLSIPAFLLLAGSAAAADNGVSVRVIYQQLPTDVSSTMTYDDGVNTADTSSSGKIKGADRLSLLLHFDRRQDARVGFVQSLGLTYTKLESQNAGIVHTGIGATWQPALAIALGAGFGVELAVPIGAGAVSGEIVNTTTGERVSSSQGLFGEIGLAVRPTYAIGHLTLIADVGYHWQREFLAYDISAAEKIRENNTYSGMAYGIGAGWTF